MIRKARLARLEAASAAMAPDETAAVTEVEALLGVRLDSLDRDRLEAARALVSGALSGMPPAHDCEAWLSCGCTWCDLRRQAQGVEGTCDVCTSEHSVVGSMPHDSRVWLGDRLETRSEAIARGADQEHLAPISTKREALRYLAQAHGLTPNNVNELAAATPEEIAEALSAEGLTH